MGSLAQNNIQIVTFPPHFEDLVPCDFFLLPLVKRQLKVKKFHSVEDARAFFEGAILDLPQSAWSGALENWFQRMATCIHANGGLFKNLDKSDGL